MAYSLESKVIVIIGASQGIGASASGRLAREGATAVLGGVSEERGAAFADELSKAGGKAEFQRADLRDGDSLTKLMDGVVKRHGRIDGLFNNGADLSLLEQDFDAVDTDIQVFRASLTANLEGYLLACRAAIPHMVRNGGGSIVQTSSLAASRADTTMIGYSCSKAGVDALTRHVAIRWGKDNIRCNAIYPGMIMTEKAHGMLDAGVLPIEAIDRFTPSPRLGKPEDIAALAAFLLSDDAGFINGQIITVDGGLHQLLIRSLDPFGIAQEARS